MDGLVVFEDDWHLRRDYISCPYFSKYLVFEGSLGLSRRVFGEYFQHIRTLKIYLDGMDRALHLSSAPLHVLGSLFWTIDNCFPFQKVGMAINFF